MLEHALASELEHEMERERSRWLRRRFVWMCAVSLVLSVPALLVLIFVAPETDNARYGHNVRLAWYILASLAYAAAMLLVLTRHVRPLAISVLAISLTAASGALNLPLERYVAHWVDKDDSPAIGEITTEFNRGFRAGYTAADRARQTRTATTDRAPTTTADRNPSTATRATSAPSTAATPTTTLSRSTNTASLPTSRPQRFSISGVSFNPALQTALMGIYYILVAHIIPCIFMPWKWRDSALIGVLLLGTFALILTLDVSLGQLHYLIAVVVLILAAAATMPGIGICLWRYSRFRRDFRLRFESGKYHELRGELAAARRIHETSLPPRVSTPNFHLDYAYAPMRDIGGDLLFHRAFPRAGHTEHLIVLIDVTGHGVAAALTVNRLLGELERIVGEASLASSEPACPAPGDVLAALNSYTRLLLSEYGLYLSALVFRFTTASPDVDYASGGHPTAHVLQPDQLPQDLESTTLLLGVLDESDFVPETSTFQLLPGQTLLACTDGATETADPAGQTLRTAGFRALSQQLLDSQLIPPESVPQTLLTRLAAIRQSEAEDDVLILTIRR
jgi:serine phosphatase RsbU (regulator of sigma subunit)